MNQNTTASLDGHSYNRHHLIWLLSGVLALPAVNLFGLQALYEWGWMEYAYSMGALTKTGENVVFFLLDMLSVIINCAKVLPLFVVLGWGAVRLLRSEKEVRRATRKGLVIALACLLLLPLLSSFFLASVFDVTLATEDFIYLLLNALLLFAVDGVILLLCGFSVRRARRAGDDCLAASGTAGLRPTKQEPFLRLLLRITLYNAGVRLLMCVLSTVFDLITIGAPQNLFEVWTLGFPYIMLALQSVMGYLLMVWIAQGTVQKNPTALTVSA